MVDCHDAGDRKIERKNIKVKPSKRRQMTVKTKFPAFILSPKKCLAYIASQLSSFQSLE